MTVFEKTLKGQEEVKNKAHNLSMIERRVLIFIDGKRTLDDLRSLPGVKDLDGVLSLLSTQGYIVQMAEAKQASTPTSETSLSIPHKPSGGAADSPFRELPETFQPDKFNMAKHYMINTLNHFKGFYGATRLVREIDACQTHEELRGFYDAWCERIDGTRAGNKQGGKLRQDLLDVL